MMVSRCNKRLSNFSGTKSLPRIYIRPVSPNEHKETPSCTCPKASYTLEAAVIFPIVAGFIVFILMFFRILQVQTGVSAALAYASRMTAVEACAVESEPALLVSAEGFMISKLKDNELVESYVKGGMAGISLLKSDFSGENVELYAEYTVKFPFNFFEISGYSVSQKSLSRKWIGRRLDSETGSFVYITDFGSVYHKSKSCSYLDLSINSVNISEIALLRNKSGTKYSACSKCVAKNKEGSRVYITDYGTLYHSDISCSALKRTIYIVKLSEVDGLPSCSKCGGT